MIHDSQKIRVKIEVIACRKIGVEKLMSFSELIYSLELVTPFFQDRTFK